MTVLLVSIAVIGLAALVGWLLWDSLKGYKSINTWPQAAQRMGLTHVPAEPRTAIDPGTIEGTYQGHFVWIGSSMIGQAGHSMTMTVRFGTPLGVGLALKAGVSPGGDSTPGGDRSVQTGADEFDRRFEPRASDAAAAGRLLQSRAVRRGIEDLAALGTGLRIDDEKISLITEGLEGDPATLEQMVRMAVSLAGNMEAGGR